MIELVADTYVPKPLDRFFEQGKRFYVLYGGRGSGKSWAVAAELIEMSLRAKHRILCCREIQNSIKHSVKKLLEDTIERLGLVPFFEIKDTMIRCRPTGSEFLFAGLRHNSTAIKSMEGLTAAWIEEGQSVSEQSFTDLTPTIRQEGGYIVITMNPRLSTDYLYETFVAPNLLRPDAARVRMNWDANQEFPKTLRGEMEWDRDHHPAKYQHVWEGELLVDDEALVFRDNVISEWFDTPDDAAFMLGADFGFARDPSVLVRSFMSVDESTIYVDHEAGGVGIELDDHPAMYDEIPGARENPIVADSARPETISYLNRKGFSIRGAAKGKGSVEDGIAFLQSKRLVIHPRCPQTFVELKTLKYQRHGQTNEIIPKPEDKDNHRIDALRYAWERMWHRSGELMMAFW